MISLQPPPFPEIDIKKRNQSSKENTIKINSKDDEKKKDGLQNAKIIYAKEKAKRKNKLLLEMGSAIARAEREADFPYDLNMRGNSLPTAPTFLRTEIAKLLRICLSPKDLSFLMKRFDTDCVGTVDIIEIFGCAKLIYFQHTQEGLMEESQKKQLEERKNLFAQRSAFFLSKSEVLNDCLISIQNKINTCALKSTKETLRSIKSCRGILSIKEFKSLLSELGLEFCTREESMLIKKYYQVETDSVNGAEFRFDFEKVVRGAKRADAFITTPDTVAQSLGNRLSNKKILQSLPRQVTPAPIPAPIPAPTQLSLAEASADHVGMVSGEADLRSSAR